MAKIINTLMTSKSWSSSVFFFSYDEGGGPYDHVPPVPGPSNKYTDSSLGSIPDISTIAVNADSYKPCYPSGGTPTLHCDLKSTDPGAKSTDAPAEQGFAAQLGFRLPNFVVSPFTRKHYVSHIPMDHTAVIKFVENRFIGQLRAPDCSRCGPAKPAGLLRLHQQAVGHAAYAAYASVVQFARLQSVPAGGHGTVTSLQLLVRSSQLETVHSSQFVVHS